MAKITVVNSAWTKRKASLVGAVVAAISVALWHGLDQWNEAWDYEMPDLLFAPLFFGILLVYPIVTLVICYRRLPDARVGLLYALGFGIGWLLALEVGQAVEFGPWKGFRPEERTVLNWLKSRAQDIAIIVPVCVGVSMAVWGLCRSFRGKVVVQDRTLCWKCGYNLTGNVSGRCPECGESIRSDATARNTNG
jgi:hypothetical protein